MLLPVVMVVLGAVLLVAAYKGWRVGDLLVGKVVPS